jgi:hypothetical protein
MRHTCLRLATGLCGLAAMVLGVLTTAPASWSW